MGKTSTEVKRRSNDKTYKRWFADLRMKDFEHIEVLRGDMSRAAFLKKIVLFFEENNNPHITNR